MKARNDTQNGIDIGASCICWARAIPRDGLVTNVGIQPLVTGHVEWWDSVRDGLVELVGAVKLSREDVVVSIPADIALVKKIRMDAEEADPDAVIEWELSQQLPGSTDEYIWDRTEISSTAAVREFLVAGCGRQSIDHVQASCKAAKVSPSAVDIDLFALVNVFEMNYAEHRTEPCALALIDAQRTKVALTRDGKLLDVEFFDHLPEMKAIESYAAALGAAVDRLAEFAGLASRPPLFIAGSGLMQEGFAVSLTDALKGSDVLYPFRTVTCNVAMTDEELRRYAPQLAVAVGLALTTDR